MKRSALGWMVLALLAANACEQKSDETEAEPTKDRAASKATASSGTAAAKASAKPAAKAAASTAPAKADLAASADAADTGDQLTIPAGELRAGSKCMDVLRVRPNELVHESINMGEFKMDRYPYPNESGKAAMLNVTHAKATALCKERGKRLCSELEWERACKGPKNNTFMWGAGFKAKQCDGQTDHLSGQRANCKSEFGVMDMIGVSLEWTASSWDRGSSSGDMVVRGSRAEKVSWLSARCAHSRKRDPHKSFDNVGFRCCSGPVNSAKVELRPPKAPTLEAVTDIDEDFQKMLRRAMPKDHREVGGAQVSFDQVYRWHPVGAEEMLVAQWRTKPAKGRISRKVTIFKQCGSVAWRAAVMKGPAEKIGKPKEGVTPRKLSFDVGRARDRGTVALRYWHGHVKFTAEPSWMSTAIALEDSATPPKDLKKALKGGILQRNARGRVKRMQLRKKK